MASPPDNDKKRGLKKRARTGRRSNNDDLTTSSYDAGESKSAVTRALSPTQSHHSSIGDPRRSSTNKKNKTMTQGNPHNPDGVSSALHVNPTASSSQRPEETHSRAVRHVPCQARGMPLDHQFMNAHFEIPVNVTHGQELYCSHPGCRASGVKFCWCAYCSTPVAKRKFRSRHHHFDSGEIPQELPSSPSPALTMPTTDAQSGLKPSAGVAALSNTPGPPPSLGRTTPSSPPPEALAASQESLPEDPRSNPNPGVGVGDPVHAISEVHSASQSGSFIPNRAPQHTWQARIPPSLMHLPPQQQQSLQQFFFLQNLAPPSQHVPGQQPMSTPANMDLLHASNLSGLFHPFITSEQRNRLLAAASAPHLMHLAQRAMPSVPQHLSHQNTAAGHHVHEAGFGGIVDSSLPQGDTMGLLGPVVGQLNREASQAPMVASEQATSSQNAGTSTYKLEREPEGAANPGVTAVRCQARGMPPEHKETGHFLVTDSTPHGAPLSCFDPTCRSQGVKFCYCTYCRMPVSKANFRIRHNHCDFVPPVTGVQQFARFPLSGGVGGVEDPHFATSEGDDESADGKPSSRQTTSEQQVGSVGAGIKSNKRKKGQAKGDEPVK